jgi:hypothetical protein
LNDDLDDILKAAHDIGLIDTSTRDAHRVKIAQMIRRAFGAIKGGIEIDFSQDDLPQQLQRDGLALFEDGFVPPVLPMDVLLIQRKFAGIFLLAARLRARIDLADMLQRHVCTPDPPAR